MGVLLDTGFLLGLHHKRDENHRRAETLMLEIVQGQHGAAHYSDYVVDELLTLTWRRSGNQSLVRALHEELLGARALGAGRLVFIGERVFHEAASLHRRLHARLSFTDCTSVALANDLGIEKIASFDDGFDGHLTRIQ